MTAWLRIRNGSGTKWQWQQRLEADPEAKAFHDAIRDLVEQKATDNYVSRVRARRLARVSETEKRFGWGDR